MGIVLGRRKINKIYDDTYSSGIESQNEDSTISKNNVFPEHRKLSETTAEKDAAIDMEPKSSFRIFDSKSAEIIRSVPRLDKSLSKSKLKERFNVLKEENLQLNQKVEHLRSNVNGLNDGILKVLSEIKKEKLKHTDAIKDLMKDHEKYNDKKMGYSKLKLDRKKREKEKELLLVHLSNVEKEVMRASDTYTAETDKVIKQQEKVRKLKKTIRKLQS